MHDCHIRTRARMSAVRDTRSTAGVNDRLCVDSIDRASGESGVMPSLEDVE